jgi:hypothetical protein
MSYKLPTTSYQPRTICIITGTRAEYGQIVELYKALFPSLTDVLFACRQGRKKISCKILSILSKNNKKVVAFFRPWRIILHHFHQESYENKK